MSLSEKLQLKSGKKLTLLNAPKFYFDKLTDELEDISINSKLPDNPDALLLFVNNLAEARQLATFAVQKITPDTVFWIAYPKTSPGVKSNINRDKLWEEMESTGWRPVRQVAIDDIWTAMRFKPSGNSNAI